MSLKRNLLTLSLLALVLALLAACGGQTQPQASQPAAPAAPKATEASKPASAPTTAPAAKQEPAKAAAKNTLIDIAVGDETDNGWNKAHIESTTKITKERGWAYLAYKNLNPGSPAKPVCENIVEELINQAKKDNPGGKILVRYNSDDFIPCADAMAKKFPDVFHDHISGDHVLKGGAPANLTNNMGAMEYTKTLAGCAAANLTKSGVIGYVNGPDNDETRRFFNSFAWGAQYCGKKLGKTIKAINLVVGFWFHIPGQTNDPQQLLGQARALNADIFASGIDTQDALQFAKQLKDKGENAYSFPYDYLPACSQAPNSCGGIPYFNWDAEVNYILDAVDKGTFKSEFKVWNPEWKNVLTPTGTVVGFVFGPSATDDAKKMVQQMADDYASGKLKLFQGPVKWADGSTWVEEGKAPDYKDIWYSKKLIENTQAYGK